MRSPDRSGLNRVDVCPQGYYYGSQGIVSGDHSIRRNIVSTTCPTDRVYLDEDAEKRIRNRLRRLNGQVSGIERMLQEHKSCDDVLVQIAALKQAVTGVAVELLEAHMETCVMACVERGEGVAALESLKTALSRVLKHA